MILSSPSRRTVRTHVFRLGIVLLLCILLFPNARVAEAQRADGLALRMISFNIRYPNPDDGIHYWPNRRAHVVDLLKYYRPDILGLQEAMDGPLHEIVGALDIYDFVGVGRDDGRVRGEYSPILYRRDLFELQDWGTFWLSTTPADTGSVGWDASLTRIVTWAHLRHVQSGQDLAVFNTHFDHRGRKAREQSARLLHRITGEKSDDRSVIVMGDFNADPRSRPYSIMVSGAPSGSPKLRDARRISRISPYGPEGTSGSFEADGRQGNRIDYVFVGDGIGVSYYAALPDQRSLRYPSDHRPVLVDLFVGRTGR